MGEPFQRRLVSQAYLQSTHGQLGCTTCHAGDPNTLNTEAAHRGFVQRPSAQPEKSCGGCHSGRVAAEFTGAYEGFPADVHLSKAKMTCTSCHTAAQLHGDGTAPPNRRAVSSKPSCTTCHPSAAPGQSRLQAHNIHGDRLHCAVCHGGIIRSCSNCHAGEGATSRPTLKIGRNTDPNIPHRYTLMRHVPTTPDMIDRLTRLTKTLVNFDRIPTWKPATPHNIQRLTARSRTCDACHNNPNLFLRLQDLDPMDSQANGRVVTAPPRPLPSQTR